MSDLYAYVMKHARRGDCTCGRCIDASEHPQQPTGHTADLQFFRVSADNADREAFEQLARAQFPHWFDGNEHNYLEMGADIGDQGAALMTMGLGSLLGSWRLLTPTTLGIDGELAAQMAGMGFIAIRALPTGGEG